MRKPLRTASFSLALGVFALLAGALQAQAAITFPANQQPFNLLVGDGTTVVNVCVFFSDHKRKKDFRAVVDWGDGSADTTDITPAKNGRNRFFVRSTHNYAGCGIFPVTCDISYKNGQETGQDTNEATVSTSNVVPVLTMGPGCPAPGDPMTASVPDAGLGTTYDWQILDTDGTDLTGSITSGLGTNAIAFPAAATGERMTVNLTQIAGGCPTGPTATKRAQVDFGDVPASHPQHGDVCTAGANLLTAGCGGGNFCPDDVFTRQTLALVGTLVRHRNDIPPYDVPEGVGNNTDVPDTDDFVDFVEAAIADGWMAECDVTGPRFCPTDVVTRAQLARFGLVARDGLIPAPPDPLVNPYDDVLVGDFADEYINQMKDEFALIPAPLGCGTNLFCPSSAATRAHAVHFLINIFGVPAP